VNLVQGDYGRETVFSENPVAQAIRWRHAGALHVHIVDLDGAKAGYVCVAKELRAIASAGVPFEVGGGIRDMTGVRLAFDAGAARVILGTAAHRNPAFLAEAARAFPGRVAVGIDALNGIVAVSGWVELTETDAVGFAKQVEETGAARIIYTDILRDGMMEGPNIEGTQAVAQAVSIPVTASGGISSLEDIRNLRRLEKDGVDEAIVGRALYLESFTLQDAIAISREPIEALGE